MQRCGVHPEQLTFFETVGDKIVLPFKRCCGCKTFKPRDQFRLCTKSKDGLQNWCKECSVEYARSERGLEMARLRKEKQRAKRPMMESIYQARARIRAFEQLRQVFDHV